jgi:hypothetical protein
MTSDPGLTRAHAIEVAPPGDLLGLLRVDALADAARRLPAEAVEHHVGLEIPQLLPAGEVRRLDRAAEDVVRTIGTNGCWVMLTALASLPEYRPLLLRLGAPLQLAVRAAGETPVAHDMLAFVGAPHANVPIHYDVSHHLLVQVQGTKTVGVGSYDDPNEHRRQIERAMRIDRLNADTPPDRTVEFTLGPGDGLILPAFTFHWVEGGDDVSVAAACLVTSVATRRRADAYRISARRA